MQKRVSPTGPGGQAEREGIRVQCTWAPLYTPSRSKEALPSLSPSLLPCTWAARCPGEEVLTASQGQGCRPSPQARVVGGTGAPWDREGHQEPAPLKQMGGREQIC